MNYKKAVDIFNKYYNTFPTEKKGIVWKYNHIFRVVDFANNIALSLNLNEEDTLLAKLCALFHDIGRFEQFDIYNTFIDADSFDHGTKSYEILIEEDIISKLDLSKEDQKVLLLAVKLHNKFETGINTKREQLFIDITRDADKLDIMKATYYNLDEVVDGNINDKVLSTIYNNKLVDNKLKENKLDLFVGTLAFIFDINFNYSIKYIKDNLMKYRFIQLNKMCSDKRIDELKLHIDNYLEERLKVC